MCFLEKCDARGSAQRRRRLWRRRRNFFALEDQKRVFLTKNESTFLRARHGEGAKSCGSDCVVVVSAVKSSCELGDRLLQGDTACKQLVTDNANVIDELCSCRIISTTEAAHSALSCQHHGWLSVRADAASALQVCIRTSSRLAAETASCQSSKPHRCCCSEHSRC